MLLRAIKNTRASDEQVRESYRRRLDEIFATKQQVEPEQDDLSNVVFELPAVDDEEAEPRLPYGNGEPALGPVATTAVPAPLSAGSGDMEGAAARIAHSLTSCLSAAVEGMKARQSAATGARLQNVELALENQTERLNAMATRLAQSQEWQQAANSQLAGMAEALGGLTASVAGASESLRALRSDQNSQADRLVGLTASLAQLAEAQPALQAQLAAQAASVAELTAAVAELARAHKAMQSRLDAQADALRQFHARSGAQQTMLDSYREAVDRLREITAVQALPVTLPDNL